MGDALYSISIRLLNCKDLTMNPHLDAVALAYFESEIRNTDTYIEYGCGGSTVRAIELGVKNVIVAESDPFWVNKVKAVAEPILKSDQSLYIEYINFGCVEKWGTPTKVIKEKALAYVETVWDKAEQLYLVPNAVLIDGWFRVSAACETAIRGSLNTKVMFDDAFRKEYAPFRKVVADYEIKGRILTFDLHTYDLKTLLHCKESHILSTR